MSWSDDDWGKPFFPTRFGSPQGHATERKMLDAVGGFDGIRTKIRTNPDGSTTILKTRGGMPVFTTTTVVQKPVTASLAKYFLHGVEVPMTVGAFYIPGGEILPIEQAVKYPTFHGEGFLERIDHAKTQHFDMLNFAATWSDGTVIIAHSGWDGRYVEPASGTSGLHSLVSTTSPTAVLNNAVPGGIGICFTWAYMTSGLTVEASAMESLLYADGYPYDASAQAKIKGVAGSACPIAAFSRGGETFYVALNISTCGAAVAESQLGLNKGLPNSVEMVYSTIFSVDGTTPPVDISLPPLPTKGFFKYTGSDGSIITPMFQSYGAHPSWFEVNKSGTRGITVTRGGYYSQNTHGIRDFAHAGMLAEIDLVTGSMSHIPVDTVFHRKYVTHWTRDAFSLGRTLPASSTGYQYDIIRMGFDSNDNEITLAQGVKFVSDSNAILSSTTIFAVFKDGVSLVRLIDTEAPDAAIQTLYVNFDDDLFLFCVCKRPNNYSYSVDYEYVLMKGGAILLTWPVSFVKIQSYDVGVYSVVSGNTASSAYVAANDVTLPLTGNLSICEPYMEHVSPTSALDTEIIIDAVDIVATPSSSRISLRSTGKTSIAVSKDKKRIAVSVAAGVLLRQSVDPIPCLNAAINISDSTITTFGEPFTFYNRLNFLDSLP